MVRSDQSFARILIIITVLASFLIGAAIGGGVQNLRRALSPFNRNVPVVTAPTGTPTAMPTPTAEPTEDILVDPTPTPSPTREATARPSRTPRPTATSVPTETASPPSEAPLPTEEPPPTAEVAVDPTTSPPPLLTVTYTGGELSLRSTPDFGADNVIGTLTTNATANVIGQSSDGLLVKIDDGARQGWVTASATYVRITGDLDSVPVLEE